MGNPAALLEPVAPVVPTRKRVAIARSIAVHGINSQDASHNFPNLEPLARELGFFGGAHFDNWPGSTYSHMSGDQANGMPLSTEVQLLSLG
uniref:Uncharacterized protein n=1 Tax=Mycena chlorophos TaxID=658473 RepID=A0ABQ0LBB2_MYCCL|nr:predicted protein [Mycena chlorophos]